MEPIKVNSYAVLTRADYQRLDDYVDAYRADELDKDTITKWLKQFKRSQKKPAFITYDHSARCIFWQGTAYMEGLDG